MYFIANINKICYTISGYNARIELCYNNGITIQFELILIFHFDINSSYGYLCRWTSHFQELKNSILFRLLTGKADAVNI